MGLMDPIIPGPQLLLVPLFGGAGPMGPLFMGLPIRPEFTEGPLFICPMGLTTSYLDGPLILSCEPIGLVMCGPMGLGSRLFILLCNGLLMGLPMGPPIEPLLILGPMFGLPIGVQLFIGLLMGPPPLPMGLPAMGPIGLPIGKLLFIVPLLILLPGIGFPMGPEFMPWLPMGLVLIPGPDMGPEFIGAPPIGPEFIPPLPMGPEFIPMLPMGPECMPGPLMGPGMPLDPGPDIRGPIIRGGPPRPPIPGLPMGLRAPM